MIVIREGEPPVEMKTGDEPFEVFILSACALWGLFGLVTLSRVATASASTIPTWGAYIFYAFLAVGSAVSLLGIVYEAAHDLLGFYIERSGLYALLGLSIAYSIWAGAASGWRAGGFVLLLVGVGGASFWRIRRINKGLRAVAPGGES